MTQKKQKLLGKAIYLFLLLFMVSMNVFSQNASNSGTEFYVAFGKNDTITTVKNIMDNRNVELILRVTGSAGTRVTLSFTEDPTLNTILVVPAEKIYNYTLSTAQARAAYSARTATTKKSIHVTATEPISLVAMNSANTNIEATLVWPVESYGREYYNIGLAPEPPESYGYQCNGYLLIATKKDTKVTHYSTAYEVGNFETVLQAGEVYYFYAADEDTRGTRIVSNEPIAFFNNSTRSRLLAGTSPRNNITFEQFMPTNTWGNKFIVPTNELNAIYARVYAITDGTKLTVKHSDGTTQELTIQNWSGRYVDIKIDENNNRNSRACYITSDKPVAVCVYHYPRATSGSSQPGEAWLPPIEQKVRNIVVSPLDFNGQHTYMRMEHYFMIVTPTVGKENTTISINGGALTGIESLPEFTWIADNVGGSGYSYGRYYFGDSYPPSGAFLNQIAFVDNPNGMIALAYGQGSYTNYFYTVGSAFRDLTASFTVNGESYIDVEGKAFCNTSDFKFVANPDTLTNLVWTLNGTVIASGNMRTVEANGLKDGYYTVSMTVNNKTYTTYFHVGGGPVVWTPEANGGSDKQNWNNPANWTPLVVPSSCNNVFIPGNSSHYPVLTPSEKGVCKNIYFIQGAELGRPDLLTYEKAYVQYNFGLSQTNQINDQDNTSLLLTNTSTVKRMQYSASTSDPLDRERWYLLSSPLRGVVTGDLSFGGFPLTFLKKFDPVKRAGQNYSVGNWTTPYTSMTEPVVSPSSVTSGFAFFMYGYDPTGNAARNLGCEESGYFSNPAYKDQTCFPFRSGEYYGIKGTNGILELPFFADSTSLFTHRTQVYNHPAANESAFYYIYDGSGGSTVNSLSGEKETIKREANNGNYRFAPENYNSGSGKWEFQPQINHPVSGLKDGDEFLVGNPYMSSIDMVKFLEDNPSALQSSYRIWNGDDYDDYSIDVSSGVVTPTNPKNTNRYIAPLQGFILTYTGTGNVTFDVTHISTVRPAGAASNLRSAGEAGEENTLRIKAENSLAASYSVIKYREGASNAFTRGKDVQKLFSPNGYVPEIYTLAGEIPASIRFIGGNGEIIVPIGVKTNRTGDIQLTISGMNKYSKASKIEFIDALENKVINLTGMPDYTYKYNNKETGIQNGRFSLRIGNSMTALPEVNSPDEIKVYGDSNGIYVVTSSSNPVQKLEIYDLQGRKRYESASGASYYPVQDNVGKSPVIVKVITANGVTSYKLQLKVEN